jgi:hypothetical protein
MSINVQAQKFQSHREQSTTHTRRDCSRETSFSLDLDIQKPLHWIIFLVRDVFFNPK